jgi:hypothetical protein
MLAATSTNANAPTTPPTIGATEEEEDPDELFPPSVVVPFAALAPGAPDAEPPGLEPGWVGEDDEGVVVGPVVGAAAAPGAEAPPVRRVLPVYVNATVAGKVGNGPVRLLLLTSSVLRDFKPTRESGTGPVRLFPFKMMVASNVRFDSEGEMVPTKPSFWRIKDTTSPLELHVTPFHAGDPQGFGPTHVEATDCGYPAAARKSSNELTITEQATPGPPQKDPLSYTAPAEAGNAGSSPSSVLPLRITSVNGRLANSSGS